MATPGNLTLPASFKVTHGYHISGKNYYQISDCDGPDIGSWSGSPTLDNATYVEGTGAYSEIMKTAGTNDMTFTPAAPLNLTNVHLRLWVLDIHGGVLDIKANGGMQLWVSDGVDTGYWYVSGRDEYPGGWYQLIVYTGNNVDNGTKPVMNNITTLGFRLVLGAGAKNFENIWWDNFIWCDGLIIAGDDAGDPWSYDSVGAEDFATTGRWGIIQPFGGVNFLTGELEIGDIAGNYSTLFEALNEVVVFVDKSAYILASLYAISAVGHSSRSTSVKIGAKAGTAGISGCFIKTNVSTLAFELTATDTDVDTFGIYASTFDTYGTVDLQSNGTYLEILDNTWVNGVGQIQPNTMTFQRNNIISGIYASGSVLMEFEAHQMQYNTYIANIYGIEINSIGTYPIIGDQFSGSISADLNNTSGGLVTINATESNVSTYTGNTVIVNTVYITITVQDQEGNPVQNARVAVYNIEVTPKVQLMNELTPSSGIATEAFNYPGSEIDILIRVRKSSSPGLRYIPFEAAGQIDEDGFSLTVRLVEDGIALE